MTLDLAAPDAPRLRGFGRDDDTARVAVNAVAQRRRERQRIRRVPLARLKQVRLDVCDESVGVPLLVRMDDHARSFVRKQNVPILINDGQARRFNFLIGFCFGRAFKKFVVDV